jgi:hypothetical protein
MASLAVDIPANGAAAANGGGGDKTKAPPPSLPTKRGNRTMSVEEVEYIDDVKRLSQLNITSPLSPATAKKQAQITAFSESEFFSKIATLSKKVYPAHQSTHTIMTLSTRITGSPVGNDDTTDTTTRIARFIVLILNSRLQRLLY